VLVKPEEGSLRNVFLVDWQAHPVSFVGVEQ